MRRAIIVVVAVAVLAGGFFFFGRFQQRRAAAALEELQTEPAMRGSLTAMVGATGTVRSNQSATLMWQTTGQVAEVLVDVGEIMQAEQRLAVLAQTSLPQNVILAQAELVNAEQALDDLLMAKTPRVQTLQAVEDAQQALEDFVKNFPMQQAQAELALVTAQDTLAEAERLRNNLNFGRASDSVINAAEADYILAENEVDKLKRAFNQVSGRPDDDPVRALALTSLSAAEQKRDSALRNLNWYKGTPSQLEVSEADANLALAQAGLAEAESDWEALRDGPDPIDIAMLEAQVADAMREWERVKDGIDPDDVAAAEARVAAAQATLDLAHLKAPFGGTITALSTKPGDQVSPGEFAFQIDDLSRLLVDVEVSEVDINRIRIGQPVNLTFDAILGKQLEGVVSQVGLAGNVVQGTVNFGITIELVGSTDEVKPGMTAAVNIIVNELSDVLLVPNRAVRVREGRRVVFVLKDGSLETIEVSLGASSETVSEVLDGDLRVGDAIVLNPPPEPIFFGGPPGGGRGGRP